MQVVAGRSVVVAVVVVSVLSVTTTAHMMSLGSCRSFQGMENFDPVRFNGTWYVVAKVGTRSDCLSVNYNLMGDDQSFRVQEVRRPPYTDVIPLDLAITNTGMLNRHDAPSKYSVTWYTGIIPMTGTYTLVDTDYDNYAVDYECQQYAFIRRVSATILSKTPQMDPKKLTELKNRLESEFDVPRDRMNSIDQDNCIPLDANDFNLVIDEEGVKSAKDAYKKIERLKKLPQSEAAKELASTQE